MNKCITSLALVFVAVVGLAAFQNNPTIDILRFRGGPTVRTGSADPESAVTASQGSLYMRTNGSVYRKETGTGSTGWIDLFDVKRKRAWVHFWPGNQTPQPMGYITISTTGSMSNGSTADEPGTTFTHATSGSAGGPRISGSIPLHELRHDPTMLVKIRTGADITSQRIFIGWATNVACCTTDGASLHLAGFRYSTSAGDTAWMPIVNNNTASPTVGTAMNAVTASTDYELKIVTSGDGTSIAFTINGGTPQTMTTGLPSATQGMFPTWSFTPLVAANRSVTYFRVYAEW